MVTNISRRVLAHRAYGYKWLSCGITIMKRYNEAFKYFLLVASSKNSNFHVIPRKKNPLWWTSRYSKCNVLGIWTNPRANHKNFSFSLRILSFRHVCTCMVSVGLPVDISGIKHSSRWGSISGTLCVSSYQIILPGNIFGAII